ncbi:Pol protein [Phytophthora palmivora]|uniref:Pol protein n=1 Tax=Phytophthora palmivora TaxID=4796 RepID=A0A2P4XAU8_9STRA|nr:Pol protein [Phytophthora palmivora]
MAQKPMSLNSTPTFCVRKLNGKWRLVRAYNKQCDGTDATGYYQILIQESDIPLTAVTIPSEMLWEGLVMPQGLSNDPAMFNRLVTQLFRPLRTFAQAYFDDSFVHSRLAGFGMEVLLKHLYE